MTTSNLDPGDQVLADALDGIEKKLPMALEAPPRLKSETIAGKRRRRGQPPPSRLATVLLVRSDGVLRWIYERPPSRMGPRRRSIRAARLVAATVVKEFSFMEVEPNHVVEQLVDLDRKLTPNQGMRRWEKGQLEKVNGALGAGNALLFIHGTFSKSEVFFDELKATPEGRDFLDRASNAYKHILTFDHPTLSVSPILNAFDLDEALGGFRGRLDIICHSRGGLVAAWWLRAGKRKVDRMVCVGSPLEGTSLAAPARLKQSLDYFSNAAGAISTAARAVGAFVPPIAPIMEMAAGLMAVIGGILTFGARTPLVDAGIAIVPGLVAQSRVSNNQELFRLHREPWPSQPEIYAVRSDFEPGDPDVPIWQFWKRWNRPLLGIGDSFADRIFQVPNDLVVDDECMVRAGAPLPSARIFSYPANDRVHHCNYFAQADTAKKMKTWLEL